MCDSDPFEFERWAVSMVDAQPNERPNQKGDRGVDGIGRFLTDNKGGIGKIIVSVKGTKVITPAMVRELSGAVKAKGAQMGVFVTLAASTKGIAEACDHGGVYHHPGGQDFPVLQHITIGELFAGKKPQVPLMYKPYIPAQKQKLSVDQGELF